VHPLENPPVFMEPENLLPHLQERSSYPYPGPDQSSPHNSSLSLQDPATYALVFLVVSFPLALLPVTYMCSSSPPFMPHALPTSTPST
jgi:hypothetical protein